MTTQEAIQWFEEWLSDYYDIYLPDDLTAEIANMAISALRAQKERENPEPLTLDEMRQMEGEPVWIVEDPDWGHWELSEDAEDYLADRNPVFYGMKYDDPDGRYGLHKLGWLAYRNKPEDGQK